MLIFDLSFKKDCLDQLSINCDVSQLSPLMLFPPFFFFLYRRSSAIILLVFHSCPVGLLGHPL